MIKYFKIHDKEELHSLKKFTAKYKDLNFSFSAKYIFKLGKILDSKNGYQLFAKYNGQIVGYVAGAEIIHHGYFTIYELFVNPGSQGEGIGSKLIDKIIGYVRKKDLKGVMVQTEFKNIPAQNLYKKLGFIKKANSRWIGGITYAMEFTSHKK